MVAPGGHAVSPGGACVVALGGAWLLWGACMVARGCVWFLWGGMHHCSRGHAWDMTRIRRYGQ